MSLKDAHLRDARVVGEGSFKLDRRRAMEKLAKFQLEDPHRYVLELIAAAVCAGSTEVVVRNDADDLELAWDGDHPTEAELDELFDHIFYRGTDRRRRMLQHLAQGLYGALGLSPRWIRVERPGLSLDFTDPMAVSRTPNRREAGVFVHVRERFSWKVFVEAISPFDDAYETKLLRERAFLAPIPVVVGGVDLTLPRLTPPPDQPHHTPAGLSGQVWLLPPRAPIDPRLGVDEGLVVTRDGVVVQRIRVATVAPLRLVGWVDAPGLQLNASRSAVVEDEDWAALLAALDDAAAALVAAQLELLPDDTDAQQAALELLARDRVYTRHFGRLELLQDSMGRRYTPEALLAAAAIWTTRDADLLVEVEPPLWLAPQTEAEGEQVHWRALRRLAGHKMRDATTDLSVLVAGRRRREELARREHPLHFGSEALLERPFTHGTLEGTVAIPLHPHGEGFLAELRVDGLPVEEIRVPRDLGGMMRLRARVASPDFVADELFRRVLKGAARQQVEADLLEAGEALLLEAAGTHAWHPAVLPMLVALLDDHARRAEVDLDAWVKGVPAPLADAPLFATVSGPVALSLRSLPGRAVPYIRDTLLQELRQTLDGLSPEVHAALALDRILVLDAAGRRILRRALGRQLTEQSRELTDAIQAAHRRSQPPVQPALPVTVLHRLTVRDEAAGLVGLVGLTGGSGPATVQIIHQGVPLGEMAMDVILPGAVASVSWDQARPDAAWAALADTSTQTAQLSLLLWPTLVRLITAVLREAGLPRPMPPWAIAALQGPVDPALLELAFLPTLGGPLRTLAEVRAAPQVSYLLTGTPPRLRSDALKDVLLLDAASLSILQKHVAGRKLKDASRRAKELVVAQERYFQQQIVPRGLPPGTWAARRRLRLPGLAGELGVRLDGDDASMLRVRCLYEDRVLESPVQPHFLRIWAVVHGDRIQPDDKLSSLRDKSLRDQIVAAVEAEARALVQSLVRDRSADATVQLAVLDQLLRRQAVPGLDSPAERQAALTQLRASSLFPTLAGVLVSLDDAAAAHTAKRLRVLSADERRETPPGELLWLRVGEPERRVLRAALGRSLPEGRSELDAWAAASQRRSRLPAEPAVPAGRFLASRVIRDGGEHTIWLALSGSGTPGLQLEWRLEGVIIDTETSGAPIALRARVTDPALQPDSQFQRPVSGPALLQARSRVEQEIDGFMLALAHEARLKGPPLASGPRPGVGELGEVRWQVIAWAAKAALSAPAWESLHLVEAADGRTLTLPALQAIARRGPLRVVPPGVRGQTIDPERPAIVAPERCWRHLEGYGRVEPFADTLPEEDRVVARRTAPPVIPTPSTAPGVLLTRPLSGARTGFVQVLRSGENSVGLHVGWRALDRVSPGGPVPLVGEVCDDGLTPDPEHRRALSDAALKALHRDLGTMSAALLPEVLRHSDPVQDRGLLLRIWNRAFASRRAVTQAEGALRTLAALPLLETGTGSPVSLLDLARERLPPRWAPRGTALSSLDPARPFTGIDREELPWVLPILGGQWEAEAAAQEQVILARRAAEALPHALPGIPADYLAQVSREVDGARLLVGISRAFPATGEVWIRSGGVPVDRDPIALAGLVAVVDVAARQVDAAWHTAKLTAAQRKALSSAHQEALQQSAAALRTPALRDRLIAALQGARDRDASLWGLALLEQVPSGITCLQAVADAVRVVIADVEVPTELLQAPGQIVLASAPGVEALLAAGGIKSAVRARRWVPEERTRRAAEAAVREARERSRAESVLRRALDQHMAVLTTNLSRATVLRGTALGSEDVQRRFPLYDAALADPDGPTGRLMAAWLLEQALDGDQRSTLGPELWARLAEHIL